MILKKYCINLEKNLRCGEHSDIVGLDLFSELKVLREILIKDEVNTPMKILNYIKGLKYFPNACNAYKILLTISVIIITAE